MARAGTFCWMKPRFTSMNGLHIPLIPLLLALFCAGCTTPRSVCQLDTSRGGVNLHIPDVAWDPQKADLKAGWCGEACIQMTLSHYGRNLPQDVIHHAGSPATTDLENDDMDKALKRCGATFVPYDGEGPDIRPFVAWIQNQLRKGRPVICGCKIYPTDHPEWDLDHFVVVSGYNSRGLLLNTQLDCNGQILVPYDQLRSLNEGYSFNNANHSYWARAVTGLSTPPELSRPSGNGRP